MRAPRRRRPLRRAIAEAATERNLDDLAQRASYVGSPEHKDTPSFAGHPRPRADASLCDRRFAKDQALATEWLRIAIRRGAISDFFDGAFPRYAWYRDGETVYEARLVNRERGEFKGYPLTMAEWPSGLDRFYE